MDFVQDACLNGSKLKILSVVDEFTRECLALAVDTRLNSRRVREVLAPLMESRGAPAYLRSDNGPEFLAPILAVFLSKSGAKGHLIRPGSPWQNGFVESFHSTLRREHLDVEVFANLADAQVKTAIWRLWYNDVRPHSGLGTQPPRLAAQGWNSGRATCSLHSNLGGEPPSSLPEFSS